MTGPASLLFASPGEPPPEQGYKCNHCERPFQGPSRIASEHRCPHCGSPPPFAVMLNLEPARAKSSGSLTLTTVFLHAAAAMNAEPSQSVVVEDSVSGVTAAVSAGMRVFGYVADSDEQALHAAGAETLHSLEELPSLLGVS